MLDGIAGSLDCFRDFGCFMAIGGASMDCTFDPGCSVSLARLDPFIDGCCSVNMGDQGARLAQDFVLCFVVPLY